MAHVLEKPARLARKVADSWTMADAAPRSVMLDVP